MSSAPEKNICLKLWFFSVLEEETEKNRDTADPLRTEFHERTIGYLKRLYKKC